MADSAQAFYLWLALVFAPPWIVLSGPALVVALVTLVEGFAMRVQGRARAGMDYRLWWRLREKGGPVIEQNPCGADAIRSGLAVGDRDLVAIEPLARLEPGVLTSIGSDLVAVAIAVDLASSPLSSAALGLLLIHTLLLLVAGAATAIVHDSPPGTLGRWLKASIVMVIGCSSILLSFLLVGAEALGHAQP